MTLKEYREKRGFTQKQLAEVSGITIKNIQHYESGYRDVDSAKLETLTKLAVALGCHISDLLNSEDLKRVYRKVR